MSHSIKAIVWLTEVRRDCRTGDDEATEWRDGEMAECIECRGGEMLLDLTIGTEKSYLKIQ